MKIRNIFIALFTVAILFSFQACGVSTQSSTVKLQVGAGPFDDPKVKGCIKAGTRDNSITNDDYYSYPVNERDYDASGQKGSDSEPITVVSKDNAEMAIPVIIKFNMITDCDTLKEFFNAYGQRYSAYLNEDGSTNEGWMTMLRKLMYDPADVTLDELAKEYTWRELYNNPEAQNELQFALKDNIGEIVADAAGGEYFNDFNVIVKKPYPTNVELKDAIAAEQAAVAGAQSAEAKARAQKAQAEAETALANAEAAKQRAIIAGYGSFDNYVFALAIQNGLNPFQPTYKVSGTN